MNLLGKLLSIWLILRFRLNPSPRCLDYADHGLPAGMNVHVLDRDPLLALAAMAIERIEQHCESSGELTGLVQMFPLPGTVKLGAVQS